MTYEEVTSLPVGTRLVDMSTGRKYVTQKSYHHPVLVSVRDNGSTAQTIVARSKIISRLEIVKEQLREDSPNR